MPRTSSAASGLRFCGMIDEPVVKASREPHEAELGRGPEHDLLGQAREVRRADRRRGDELQREILGADGVDRVAHRPVEAERRRGRRDRSIGNEVPASAAAPSGLSFIRARASRKRPRSRAEHLGIGEHVVAPGDGLRGLQMREARHDEIGAGLGLVDEGGDQAGRARRRPRRSGRAPRGGCRAPPGRCASARCAGAWPARRSARSAAPRRSCGCPRARARRRTRRASISPATWSSPRAIASRSDCVMMPCAASMAAWARLPSMSSHRHAPVEVDRGVDCLHHRRRARGEAASPHRVRGRAGPGLFRRAVPAMVRRRIRFSHGRPHGCACFTSEPCYTGSPLSGQTPWRPGCRRPIWRRSTASGRARWASWCCTTRRSRRSSRLSPTPRARRSASAISRARWCC